LPTVFCCPTKPVNAGRQSVLLPCAFGVRDQRENTLFVSAEGTSDDGDVLRIRHTLTPLDPRDLRLAHAYGLGQLCAGQPADPTHLRQDLADRHVLAVRGAGTRWHPGTPSIGSVRSGPSPGTYEHHLA
jgi:hypothetical protein